MTPTPRVLRHGTEPDAPAVATIPFRRHCGAGHTYSAPGGRPDAVILASWMRDHERCEDGKR